MDIQRQIEEVGRSVELRGSEDEAALTVTQEYDVSVEDLWDACTNADRIPRWFLPITGELREGGTYQLEGNAGGRVLRCEPPRSFRVTWEYGGRGQ